MTLLAAGMTGCTPDKKTDTPERPEDSNKTILSYPNGAQGLRNDATLQKRDGEALILNLRRNEGYYDMNIYPGKLLASLHDYTISVDYNISSENTLEGYGHFVFAFSTLAENSAEEGTYVAYRANEQRFEVSTGGYKHEEIITAGAPAPRDTWQHMLYRQYGTTGELYINGVLIGINPHMPLLSDIFPAAPTHCWIGRPPFAGDKYLTQAHIANLKIFNYAVSNAELKELSKAF